MKLAATLIAALLLAPAADSLEDSPDAVAPQPVCADSTEPLFSMEAPTIERIGPLWRATGGLSFTLGHRHLTASEGYYDIGSATGSMRDVVFTSCNSTNPHYHLEAREVTLLPDNRMRARRVLLFVGRFRVLALPSIRMTVGGRAASTNIFPTPGYDSRDGFTLNQDLRLVDTRRSRTNLDVTLTTKNGIQGQVTSRYGLDGRLLSFPGRFLTYGSLREHVMQLPQEPAGAPCDPQSLRPKGVARLRAFGRLTMSQRAYDVKDRNLVVSRQPEIGLDYTGNQISLTGQRLDPRLEIYPQLTASWGRFKETPGGSVYTQRTDLSGVAAVNLLRLGPSTGVQPVVSYRYSSYSTGDAYRLLSYAVDASHLFSNGSFVSARYIRRSESGVTPFEFDDLDIREEVQGAFQARMRQHTLGLILSYDADARSLYNWEAVYAHRTDCISTWVRWSNRFRRLVFDVSLISF